MEEELHERSLYLRSVGLDGEPRVPDETTMLRFRHLLKKQKLAPQVPCIINHGLARQEMMLTTVAAVDATFIAPPISTNNHKGERDPEMHQNKKGTSGISA